MNPQKVRSLLTELCDGRQSVAAAVRQLKSPDTDDLDFAKVDGHRWLRKGFPEVIYCEGKTPVQVAKIAKKILQYNDNQLVTRASRETFRVVERAFTSATPPRD
jgi:NCAIR mutase (PurE)-related protein